jgi:hypothetical protein
LLDRVIQQHRRTTTARGPQADESADPDRRIRALEQRVEHLEALVEGLQDSVHREAARHDKEMKALEERTRTPEVARALHEYSREHGV